MSAKDLNFGGGVSFGRKKAKKPAGMDGMTESEKREAEAYRARAKAERKRFVAATDSEFWICLCFPSAAHIIRWHEAFGFGADHAILKASDVVDSLDGLGEASSVAFGGGVSFGGMRFGAEKTKDPLADVAYTGDLEADCFLELSILHECLMKARAPERPADPTDSEHWFVLAFADRDAKDAFLRAHGLTKLGDKYMDGVAVARKLGASI